MSPTKGVVAVVVTVPSVEEREMRRERKGMNFSHHRRGAAQSLPCPRKPPLPSRERTDKAMDRRDRGGFFFFVTASSLLDQAASSLIASHSTAAPSVFSSIPFFLLLDASLSVTASSLSLIASSLQLGLVSLQCYCINLLH
ncbi:hypothetical protein PIB30_033919 [Stylosanthes scabra]|uniref:Uncharacterized protein n=1 Tax=Stylosanthes scabra TaxID=79078 RepID=A0ABU6XBS1_9FABA|nr:hypothetical protein [Stylosanthes scabra]